MKNTLISFIGLERCDIVYHYIKLLEKTGNQIVAVDNSQTKDFFGALAKDSDSSDFAETGATPVIANVGYSPDFYNQFDVAITYHGMNIDKEIVDNSDYVILCTDYTSSCVKQLNEKMKEIDRPVTIIYRDKVTKKISERTIDHAIHCNIKNRYILQYSPVDYASYVTFSHNGIQSRKELSDEFKDMLGMLICMTTEISEKDMKKMFK